MRTAQAILAFLLAAPFGAAAQTAVPRPLPVIPGQIIVVPGTTVVATDYHGAIAYERATGAFGYGYDYVTPRDAGLAAINSCGGPDCVVAIAFKNGCGILVDGPTGPVVAEGVSAREAEVRARGHCTDPQCQVIVWVCTR